MIGDDSLDANVGSLAAMTGGELFPVSGQDSDDAVLLAMEALRRPAVKAPKYVKGLPKSIETFIGGMLLSAEWSDKPLKAESDDFSNAIVAIATSMALAGMDAEKASDLAEQEGIVCHLTSLVLVDEEATAQEGIPEQRKVHLSTPATHSRLVASSGFIMSANSMSSDTMSFASAPQAVLRSMGAGGMTRSRSVKSIQASGYDDSADCAVSSSGHTGPVFGLTSDSYDTWDGKTLPELKASIPENNMWSPTPVKTPSVADILKLRDSVPMMNTGYDTLKMFIGKLSWDQHINEWLKGDMSNLMPALKAVVQVLAQRADVIKLAQDISKPSIVVVLAILALIDSSKNVGAQRFARSVFNKGDKAQVEAVMKSLS